MNDARISGCDIYGNVVVHGNDTRLFGNRIQGNVEVAGTETLCESNRSFDDEDEDGVIDESEIGSNIDC